MSDFLSGIANLLKGLQDPQDPSGNQTQTPVQPQASPPQAAPGLLDILNSTGTDASAMTPQAPQHHGLFGLHGTLRDIIGTLGDAFLVQGGHPAAYHEQRLNEQQGDAMQGFTNNPMQSIQRLMSLNPDLGEKLYNNYAQNTRLNRNSDQAYTQQVLDMGSRLLGQATPDNYPQIKSQVEQYFQSHNVTPPFDLPAQYDEKTIAGLRDMGVPITRQIQMENTQDWRNQQMDYRGQVLDERRDYHGNIIRQGDVRNEQGATRTNNDTRRTDQGDVRTDNDTTRTSNNTARTNSGIANAIRSLDQYDTGVRGNVRRPPPGTFVVRQNPDGSKTIGRVMARDAQGRPTKVIPIN